MSDLHWVGALPSGWRLLRLRHVASITNSNVDKKSYDDGQPVRLCNYNDVYKNEFITDRMEFMEATATSNEILRFTLRPSDVVITKDSESWNDIAVAACVAELLRDVVCGYHLAVLRADAELLQGRFLHRAIQATGVREQFWMAANGVTRFGLGQQGIKEALLPIPPLATQEAIADYLDEKTADLDALIEKKRKLLDLLAEERTALINQVVTKGLDPSVPIKESGIPWIGEIPAHWEIGRLKVFLDFKTSGSRGWADYYTDDADSPIFIQSGNLGRHLNLDLTNIQHVNPPMGSEGERTLVKDNDVLVCITGARTGAVAFVDVTLPVSAYINQHVALLRPNPLIADPHFIAMALTSEVGANHFQMAQYGGTKQGLGLDDVGNTLLPLPPLREQQSISTYVDEGLCQARATQLSICRQLDRLQEYRQALITAAVTGQLDIGAAA
ncbi:restriction endonuclease subunit S [Candidatus Thiodictyon syntrophicum]|uniref:restriction endonuclease subunit S n=1 Tax=Candidatus Thiodictyon syntrophicum TaxID=1166950 RepID=UPI0012FDA82E|nr:restriction endonuclease subunit S [Candidatus Thiodictyon syntrophicum]